jgi:Tfp pilus assembly protein PilF/pimeloyl-ACP methyl ester carboxylesterase
MSKLVWLVTAVGCWLAPLPSGAVPVVPPTASSSVQSHYERPSSRGVPYKKRVIVFVHGIFGDPDSTWRYSSTVYWPSLLLTDETFRDSDVYVAGYSSPYFGNSMNVDEVVTNLNNRLVRDEVFSKHREVVFVCHSLGGLIVQRLLLTYREYAKQVPFVYFFSTPQTGAQIANLGRVFSSDPLLRALIPGDENDYLQNLENEWKAGRFRIHRFCAYEKKKYNAVLVVDKLSGTRNCDDPPLAINEDHVSIVKPDTTNHDSYVALQNAFRQYPIATDEPSALDIHRTTVTSTLKGIILGNEAGGPPVSKVKVSAVGANPTETGEGGDFSLRFPNKQPGDTVQVVVNKPGYVVVNWFELKVTLPKKPDNQLLTILVCKEDEREQWSRRFFGGKYDDSIEEAYERRVRQLEDGNQKTEAALAELRQERDEARATAEKGTEELARLKPGTTTDVYEEAMALFSKGMPEEALLALDDQTLGHSIEAAQQRKTEAQKALSEAVQCYLLKARLLTIQFRFEEAERVYEGAVERAPDSAEAHFSLASFSQLLNRPDQARAQLVRALEITRKNENSYETGEVLHNLGGLDLTQDRVEEARAHLEEALQIRRRIAQELPARSVDVAITLLALGLLDQSVNRSQEGRSLYVEAVRIFREASGDDTYLALLGVTLNDLGSLDHDLHRMEDSKESYEEALKIFRQPMLVKRISLSLVATALNNLANVEKDLDRVQEARQHYQEALDVCRRLTRSVGDYVPAAVIMLQPQSPENGQTEALVLNSYGNFDSAQNQLEDARSHLEQALQIRSRIAAQARAPYLEDLAVTLIGLGALDYKQKRFEEARQHDEQGLKVCRDFPRPRRDYLSLLATGLSNLGALDKKQNRIEEARSHGEEALKIRRQLAEQNPDGGLPDVAMTLNNLGNIERLADPRQSRRYYEESLVIYRQLLPLQPASSLPGLALALNNLGGLDANEGKLDDARHHFEEALNIRRELAQQNPDGHLPDLARTLSDLGRLDALEGQVEPRQHYEDALTIRRQLVQQNPGLYLPDLAQTLSELGVQNAKQGRMVTARQQLDEALKLRRKLAESHNPEYQGEVAQTLVDIGSLDADEGRTEESRQHYEEALGIQRQLMMQDPEKYSPDLALTLDNLGALEGNTGHGQRARQDFEEALQIRRLLAQQNPEEYLPFLAYTLVQLGLVDDEEGQGGNAHRHYQEALQIYQDSSRTNVGRYQREIERVKRLLEGLPQMAPAK